MILDVLIDLHVYSLLSAVKVRQTTGRPIGVSILVCDVAAGYQDDKQQNACQRE
jgi:hypothetical protein